MTQDYQFDHFAAVEEMWADIQSTEARDQVEEYIGKCYACGHPVVDSGPGPYGHGTPATGKPDCWACPDCDGDHSKCNPAGCEEADDSIHEYDAGCTHCVNPDPMA